MTSPHGHGMPEDIACRVCGGPVHHKWTLTVLERHAADYVECLSCGCLQIPNPHWLEEAYRDEGHPIASNPDTGRFCRTYSAYVRLRALEHAGLFSGPMRALDYGGGSGLLAAMLWLAGRECRQYDPYCRMPMFAPELAFGAPSEIPDAGFSVVTALEVFEHLCDPRDIIHALAGYLMPGGAIVLSTGLYEPGVHTEAWPYLSRPSGQHVTFYTRKAIRVLAECAGLPNVFLFTSENGFVIVLTAMERRRAARRLARATRALRSTKLLTRWTDGAWDMRHLANAGRHHSAVFVE